MNKYAWCDQEDIEDWDFANVNSQAGFNFVQPASPVISAHKSGNDILFFTESNNAYYLEYLGVPYIFGSDRFASGVSPIAPNAICGSPEGAMWLSDSGIWYYQSRQALPVDCSLWQWFIDNNGPKHSRLSASVTSISSFSELWFFFSTGAEQSINDRVMVFNYVDKWWSPAYIKRQAGADVAYSEPPLMTDGYHVYDHDYGNYYSGADLPWIATFNMAMDQGSSLATILKVMPNLTGLKENVAFELDYTILRTDDNAPRYSTSQKHCLKDGCAYFPVTGRDFRMTIRQVTDGVPKWTVSPFTIYMQGRGVQ